MNIINPNIVRQLFVLLLILLLGSVIFFQLLPYFSGVLGAITVYVLVRKPMSQLVDRGWHPKLAASVLLVLSVVVILIPFTGIALLIGSKVPAVVQKSENVVTAIKGSLADWENRFGYDFTSQIDASAVSTWISENLRSIAGGTFNMFIAIAIMYFMLYYMLTNRKQLRESLFQYIPVSKGNLDVIGAESRAMVRSNAIGIPLVALAQGIVSLLGFVIFGITNPFFWALLVTIGSMIPFVGGLLGILPAFILAFSNGNDFQAWGILIYGIVIVGSTDNLIRLYVLQRLDNVHPLITLIGVIIGIPLFGFIGLIFGPLLISLFLIIVKIYKKEYGKKGSNRV
jgi:predicted PurR-regulated permease PerM